MDAHHYIVANGFYHLNFGTVAASYVKNWKKEFCFRVGNETFFN
jgi:hypothetical protein